MVYIPQDTRWGDIGKGLGGLLGNVLGAYQEKQTAADVSAIMNDASIADDKKAVEVLKKHGDPGYKMYQKLLQTQVLDAQMKDLLAQAAGRTIQNRILGAKAGVAEPMAAAELKEKELAPALTTAKIGEAQATTGAEVARTGLIGAQTEEERAAIPGTRAKSSLERLKVDQLADTLENQRAITANPKLLDQMIDQTMPGASDADKALARNAYIGESDPSKKITKMNDTIREITTAQRTANIRANAPADLKPEFVKQVENHAAQAQSLNNVVKSVEAGGSPGGPSAAFNTFLAQHGMGTQDPALLNQLSSSERLLADFVQTGSGFGGHYRVQLGREVLPSVLKGKVFNLMQVDQLAQQGIAQLNAVDKSTGENVRKEALRDTVKEYQKVSAQTQSLWWTKDGRIMYKGREVDTDLNPVKNGATELPPTSRVQFGADFAMGDAVNKAARTLGVTPQTFIKMKQAQTGTGTPPSGSQ